MHNNYASWCNLIYGAVVEEERWCVCRWKEGRELCFAGT